MMRITFAILLATCGIIVAQDLKSKPQYERILQGEDEKKATDMRRKIDKFVQSEMRVEAARVAEELLTFRIRNQGDDHWQVRDARIQLEDLKKERTAEQDRNYAESEKLNAQVTLLFRRGKIEESIATAKKVIILRREAVGQSHITIAINLENLGFLYSAQGNHASAEKYYLDALAMYKDILGVKHPSYAACLNDLGLLYTSQAKYKAAEPLFNESLNIRKHVLGEKHTNYADGLNNLATLYKEQGLYDKAEPLYLESIGIYKDNRKERDPNYADSLNNLAMLYLTQGHYNKAEPLFREALKIRKRVLGEKHPNYADSLNSLAILYKHQAHYAKAEALYVESLEINKEYLGVKHPSYAVGLSNLGMLYTSQGNYAKAEPLYLEALQIRKDVFGEKHPVYAISLDNLGLVYFSQGYFAKAEALYQNAARIRKDVLGEKHPDYATSVNNLALLYSSQGNNIKADLLLQEVIRITREGLGEKHADYSRSLNNAASIYERQGNFIKAKALTVESLRITKESLGEKHPDYAVGLHNLASIHHKMNDDVSAEQLYLDALRIRKETLGENNPKYSYTLNNLALLYSLQARYNKAEPHYLTALRISRETLGDKHPSIATNLNNLASMYDRQGDFAKAEPLYLDALRLISVSLGERHPEYSVSLNNLAASHAIAGQHAKSIGYLQRATRSYEASRLTHARATERSLGNDGENPYPLLAAMHAQSGNPDKAFQAMELNLARALLDEQSNTRVALLTVEEHMQQAEINERLLAIKPRITNLVTRVNLIEAERQELTELIADRQKLDDSLADLAATRSQRAVADCKAIQSSIPAGAAFVSWVDVAESTGKLQEHWACVVRNTGEPIWERLPGSGTKGQWTSDDNILPDRLRSAIIGNKDPTDLIRKLYAQRIAPIAKHLGNVRTLYVAGVDLMAGIPIETLADEYNISYVLSGTSFARLGKPLDKPATLLALGDPIFHPQFQKGWAELPGTRVELNRLQTMFGKDHVTILLDDHASESQLEAIRLGNKLKSYKYLHFATHGETSNIHAFDSKLILAHETKAERPLPTTGSPFIDSHLSAIEVLEYWKLDAELVTLSACETALGKSAGGDGLLGFAQAFLLAGSRSVCLSLWKVDDTATALLMDRFYANLLGKREGLKAPMNKSLALHEAKQWLRNLPEAEVKRKITEIGVGVTRGNRGKGVDLTIVDAKAEKPYSHPKYWAGFILIGAPD